MPLTTVTGPPPRIGFAVQVDRVSCTCVALSLVTRLPLLSSTRTVIVGIVMPACVVAGCCTNASTDGAPVVTLNDALVTAGRVPPVARKV